MHGEMPAEISARLTTCCCCHRPCIISHNARIYFHATPPVIRFAEICRDAVKICTLITLTQYRIKIHLG